MQWCQRRSATAAVRSRVPRGRRKGISPDAGNAEHHQIQQEPFVSSDGQPADTGPAAVKIRRLNGP